MQLLFHLEYLSQVQFREVLVEKSSKSHYFEAAGVHAAMPRDALYFPPVLLRRGFFAGLFFGLPLLVPVARAISVMSLNNLARASYKAA